MVTRYIRMGQAIFQGISKYAKFERKALEGLYGPAGRFAGVRNYKSAARGVRHGLAAGSAAGTFIQEDGKGTGSGQIPFLKTNKPHKARGRFSNRRAGKYKNKSSSCRCGRRNRTYRRRRMSRRKYY